MPPPGLPPPPRLLPQERKKLALTLQDTKTVVAKLELICGVVLHVLFAFFYLVIWQVGRARGYAGLARYLRPWASGRACAVSQR